MALSEYQKEIIAAAPPITARQRALLTELLSPVAKTPAEWAARKLAREQEAEAC